jgi:hypothetical protein
MDCRNPSATFLDLDHPREAILSIVRWIDSIIMRGKPKEGLAERAQLCVDARSEFRAWDRS